jgi:bacteriorhodopsin
MYLNLYLTILFGLNALFIFFNCFRHKPTERAYHYIVFAINVFSHFYYLNCYLPPISGQQYIVMDYGRYVHWLFVTELILIMMSNIANLDLSNKFILIFFDFFMIVFGYMAEHAIDDLSFYLYTIYSFMCYLPLLFFIYEDFQHSRCVVMSGSDMADQYIRLAIIESVIWLAYPLLWLLFNNGYIDFEYTQFGYSITDIFSKFLFLNYILFYIQPQGSLPITHT